MKTLGVVKLMQLFAILNMSHQLWSNDFLLYLIVLLVAIQATISVRVVVMSRLRNDNADSDYAELANDFVL